MNDQMRRLARLGMALAFAATLSAPAWAKPKHVLVVTTTTGFRHSSIPTAEKVIAELGQKSGAFTVEFARVEPSNPEFKGADGKPDNAKVNEAIRQVLGRTMSAAALKGYDAVIFANTTGVLPLPDKDAFLAWLKSGKGFVGMHSATDCFHAKGDVDPYIQMLGGEFLTHKEQVRVEAINQDPKHPATKHLGATFNVFDEIYIMQNFHRDQVHGLLTLDKHPNSKEPGDYPISWCKAYGKGRVFYTSLGHREDVWDETWSKDRKNDTQISLDYQKHILGGIKWALGLEKGDAKPQTAK
jgi:type 1 glutamine amidotransferase